MRAAILLCVATVLPACGCTYYVVSSGTKLGDFGSREQVQAEFGPPVASGAVEGKPFEEFRTRRKIAEPEKVIYVVMGDVVTFGFGELVWFPQQSFIAARRSIRGQTLRFVYDESGTVTGVTLDGEYAMFPPCRAETPSAAYERTVTPAAVPQTPPAPGLDPTP